jgi:hypothetical protein
MKRIRFWGTRGSLPVALTASAVRKKIVAALRGASGRTFATNAEASVTSTASRSRRGHLRRPHSCVEIETGGSEYVICDLGSGLRPFGSAALARHGPARRRPTTCSCRTCTGITSWACRFFAPAYIPGNRIFIYGSHSWLESALRRQQDAPSFPVDFSFLRADIQFVIPRARQAHIGRGHDGHDDAAAACGRFVRLPVRVATAAVVYTTDSEHKLDDPMETESYAAFFRGATS